MVREVDYLVLTRNGFRTLFDIPINEPIIARYVNVMLNELDVYEVPQNLVKVTDEVSLGFGNYLGMNEDILNLILELDKKCEDGVELLLGFNSKFTQSDWDFIIENVINNSSLKFGKYDLSVFNKTKLIFNLDTDRKLEIAKLRKGILSLRGKMGVIEYDGDIDKLKVGGEVKSVVDYDGNPISHEIYDYESLPDLYESLENRIRRLISQ